MEEADRVWDEISSVDIQEMMDRMLGGSTFSFSEYVTSLMHGQLPFSIESVLRTVIDGLAANLQQEKKMYIYLILIAVIGAMLSNFTSLLQGKQVAETAFYAVYMLFFSLLLASFTRIAAIAGDTLTQLLDFMKVLSPSYFTLVLITMVDFVLVKFALPAIHIYFLLRIANQLSKQDMFSKMSELIHDVVKFVMKTMFGIMMGLNVIQGLVVPITSQLESSAVIKLSGAIPGVGSTISSVTSTVLLAGNLVKNSVGAAGIIAVLFYCGIPLLKL